MKTSYLLAAWLFAVCTFGSEPFSNTCFLSCFSPPMSPLGLSVIFAAGVATVELNGRASVTVLDTLLLRMAHTLLAIRE